MNFFVLIQITIFICLFLQDIQSFLNVLPKSSNSENLRSSAPLSSIQINRPSSRVPLGTITLGSSENKVLSSQENPENKVRENPEKMKDTPSKERRKQSWKKPRMRDSWNK